MSDIEVKKTGPITTINAGLALMSPGDTLWIGAGIYTEGIENGFPSGVDPSRRTIIRAIPGATVIVNGVGSLGYVLRVINLSFIDFLDIIWDGANAINAVTNLGQFSAGGIGGSGCHYISIQGGQVRNLGSTQGWSGGITNHGDAGANSHLLYKGIEVWNIYGTSAPATQGLHGIYLTARDSVIEDCFVHDNSGHGIHLYDSQGTDRGVDRNIIQRNRVGGNGSAGIRIGSGMENVAQFNEVYGNGRIFKGKNAITITEGPGNRVENNNIHDNDNIAIYISSTGHSAVIRNNYYWLNAVNDIVDLGQYSIIENNHPEPPVLPIPVPPPIPPFQRRRKNRRRTEDR